MPVTLINPFEVPKGKEDDALAYWERCDAVMKKAPGFISTHLYEEITLDAKFKYINVAEWESAKHFHDVLASPEFQEVAAPGGVELYRHYPGLFQVVRTHV